MKKSILIIAILLCVSCNKPNQVAKSVEETNQPILVEEEFNQFEIEEVTKDIGRVKFDSKTGNILPGSKNIIKSLAKEVANNPNTRKIIILYNYYFNSGYNNDTKIVYDRVLNQIEEITLSSNIKDVYKDITDEIIEKASKDNECKVIHCLTYYSKKDMVTDYSERKIDALGEKPKQIETDYSVQEVLDYINNKQYKDIKYLEWSKVSSIGKDWIVRAKFKAKLNGQSVIDNSWYYIQNNKVVRTKNIE